MPTCGRVPDEGEAYLSFVWGLEVAGRIWGVQGFRV